MSTSNSDPEGKIIANLLMNDLKGLLKKNKLSIEESPVAPEVLGFLGRCIKHDLLTKKQVKARLVSIFEENLELRRQKEENE